MLVQASFPVYILQHKSQHFKSQKSGSQSVSLELPLPVISSVQIKFQQNILMMYK